MVIRTEILPTQGKIIWKSCKSMLARFLHGKCPAKCILHALQTNLARNLHVTCTTCMLLASARFLHEKCPFSCKSLACLARVLHFIFPWVNHYLLGCRQLMGYQNLWHLFQFLVICFDSFYNFKSKWCFHFIISLQVTVNAHQYLFVC